MGAPDLKSRLQSDLNDARRARDKGKTLLLAMTLAEVRNEEIARGTQLEEEELVSVFVRAVKRRREAAQQMRDGGREELALKEEGEAEILGAYLPPPLDEDAVAALVRKAVAEGASTMGEAMAAVMPEIRGRFDGKSASKIVRDVLGL